MNVASARVVQTGSPDRFLDGRPDPCSGGPSTLAAPAARPRRPNLRASLDILGPILLLALLSGSVSAQQGSGSESTPAPTPALAPASGPTLAAATEEASRPAPSRVPIDEIRRFVEVFRTVRDVYVEDIDDATLMQAAIRGLLAGLDPHSAYLDGQRLDEVEELSTGAYQGIGVELVQQPDRSLLVIAPIDDTPAARAGIRPGDLIVAIDGQPIQADDLDQAVATLRGAPGSAIRLTVIREGVPDPLELDVVRDIIRITSVRARMLEPGFGYLRLSVFQGDTATAVRAQLSELAAQAEGGLRGLVLDLRGNPGGLLTAAVEVADAFLDAARLDDPVIVSTQGRLPLADLGYRAHAGDLLRGAPIAVLIDAGSASASEVLAGALRDHGRAVLIGERSFGKGSVQSILPLDNGDSLKLTTARYYTPAGHDIQASGITPDIELGNRQPSLAEPRERDLPGHLPGSDASTPESESESEPEPEPVPEPEPEPDPDSPSDLSDADLSDQTADPDSDPDSDPVIARALVELKARADARSRQSP